jgi:hypothetical protein
MTVTNIIYQKQIKYHVFNDKKNVVVPEALRRSSAGHWRLRESNDFWNIVIADMGTGITDVIGGPHDFLPPRSDRSDEFQKLCITVKKNLYNIGRFASCYVNLVKNTPSWTSI